MSSRVETTLRAAIPAWARALLALLALAGLVVLALLRPRLPTLPWQPLQPTAEELIRQSVLFALWLLLLAICLRLAWLALKPPQRLETIKHQRPRWLPEQRQPQPVPRRPNPGELLELFRRPPPSNAATAVPADAGWASEVGMEDGAVEVAAGGCAEVTVALVGRLRIGADGTGVGERATRGLIAYLAIKRVPVTLDELTEVLWPGESPVKTRQRLWKAKRQAQRLLGGALVREQDSYALDRTRLHIDADELERLRATASPGMKELEGAVALTREEPLADVDYPWADGERRRLQAIQAELLERIAKVRLEQGDGSEALAAAEQLIQLDALNERGWCLAMEAEGALGNRQAILDRYDQLAGQLDERLGLRPGLETKETYRRLLGQE